MNKQELINKYKEQLLIIDDAIKHNVKYNNFILAHNWQIREVECKRFITDLEELK